MKAMKSKMKFGKADKVEAKYPDSKYPMKKKKTKKK